MHLSELTAADLAYARVENVTSTFWSAGRTFAANSLHLSQLTHQQATAKDVARLSQFQFVDLNAKNAISPR